MTAEVTLAEVTAALDKFERNLLAWLHRQERGHHGIELGAGKHKSLVREMALQFRAAVEPTIEAMREAARAEETFTR